jgi:hypothetical protein
MAGETTMLLPTHSVLFPHVESDVCQSKLFTFHASSLWGGIHPSIWVKQSTKRDALCEKQGDEIEVKVDLKPHWAQSCAKDIEREQSSLQLK